MELILHIGAHKTASTHLQLALQGAALAKHGLRMMGPIERRDALPDQMLTDPTQAGEIAQTVEKICAVSEAQRLLISDENIAGLTHPHLLMKRGEFYPQAVERMQTLIAAIQPSRLRIGLAIRPQDSFLVSCWLEHCQHVGFHSLQGYLGREQFLQLSWANYLSRLRRAFPAAEFVVWSHSDYPRNARAMLQALIGPTAALQVELQSNRVHRGMSDRAVAELLALPTPATPAVVQEMRMRFPIGPDLPRHDPWTTEQHAKFERLYAVDLTKISAMSNVRFIGKPPAQRPTSLLRRLMGR